MARGYPLLLPFLSLLLLAVAVQHSTAGTSPPCSTDKQSPSLGRCFPISDAIPNQNLHLRWTLASGNRSVAVARPVRTVCRLAPNLCCVITCATASASPIHMVGMGRHGNGGNFATKMPIIFPGHCANDENEPRLYRYKEECEDACLGAAASTAGKDGKGEQQAEQTYATIGPLEGAQTATDPSIEQTGPRRDGGLAFGAEKTKMTLQNAKGNERNPTRAQRIPSRNAHRTAVSSHCNACPTTQFAFVWTRRVASSCGTPAPEVA